MRSLLGYLLVLVCFCGAVGGVIKQGQKLQPKTSSEAVINPTTGETLGAGVGPSASLWENLQENLHDPLTQLFMQLILIILLARICGRVAAGLGQPAVVGEMVAGILLGPSLLGWVWPDFFHFIFPASSLGSLRLFSQIGVCLFMFVVGMELNLTQLKQQAKTAMAVSQASILVPYLLGVITAFFLYTRFAQNGTSFVAFALFIGVSMSITAFPVLARILEERQMTHSPLGVTALICAAMNDVTAWCILAGVVAVAKAKSLGSAGLNVVLLILFVGLLWCLVKPRLTGWLAKTEVRPEQPGKGTMAAVLAVVFISALATDVMGVHALFGAFLAGLIMPARPALREFLGVRLEHFSSVFLLPLFFAFTGLRLQIGLLQDGGDVAIALGLVLIATVGKLGGTMLTARLTGMRWLDAFGLGALMNTRGLVELIALNIGYDLKILSPRIFAMLVLMALITTAMTGPMLTWCESLRRRQAMKLKPA